MNYKRKKFRWVGRFTLPMKYRHKGMAKTNYRQLPKRKKLETSND